jgi:hypothetical protein
MSCSASPRIRPRRFAPDYDARKACFLRSAKHFPLLRRAKTAFLDSFVAGWCRWQAFSVAILRLCDAERGWYELCLMGVRNRLHGAQTGKRSGTRDGMIFANFGQLLAITGTPRQGPLALMPWNSIASGIFQHNGKNRTAPPAEKEGMGS